MRKKALAAALAAFLLAAPALARGGEDRLAPPDQGSVLADILLVRPLGLLAVAAGVILYVPVALLTPPGEEGAIAPAREVLLTAPAEFTFKRPLGRFREN